MANEENLKNGIATRFKTGDEQVKIASAGGIASGEARRRKRDIRKALEMLLEKEYALEDGTVLTGAEAIALKQFEKALNDGDTKAFEVVRDTAGQKPVEKVAIGANDEAKAELAELLEQRKNASK